MITPQIQSEPAGNSKWQTFALFSVCALAVSVSLGAAVVGIAKLLTLIAFLGQLWRDGWPGVRNRVQQLPSVVVVIGLALLWFGLSGFWTEADSAAASKAFFRHARIFWLVPVLYLIRSPADALKVLFWLAAAQLFVVLASWLMWLGVPVPFVTDRYERHLGVVFTGHLEQPVMTTLLVVLLWHLRDTWTRAFPGLVNRTRLFLAVFLAIANVFVIMTGRTGYLVMLVFIGMMVWTSSPKRWRAVLALTPLLVAIFFFQMSPRFHDRVLEVRDDVLNYQQGHIETSQGLRLEMWRVALQAVQDKPWFGHGVGSYSNVYVTYHGRDRNGSNNPHQQYLFWLVEFGAVGLMLLLCFFIALLRDARYLPQGAKSALVSTVAIAAVMSLANCPFFGVEMGEFFLVSMAGLLGTRDRIV